MTFRERGLLAVVVVVHLLFIVAPLDVLAPVDPHRVGSMFLHARLPYRDFTFEYPPLAIVAFVLPGLVPAGLAKSALALQATTAELAVAWFVLRHHRGALFRYGALSVVLFPFMAGGFDALAMAAIAISTQLLSRERAAGWWVAATGAAAKLSPGAAWVWGRVRLRTAIVAAAVTAALTLSPLLVADDIDRTYIGWSLHRGVEAESVAASITWLWRAVRGAPTPLVYRFRANEILGAGRVSVVVMVVALAALAFIAVRASRADPWVASCAAVLVLMCGFKVLSPQYVVWPAPLIAVLGRRWFPPYLAAGALTYLVFSVAQGQTMLLGFTAARNAVLVALAVGSLVALHRSEHTFVQRITRM